MFELINKIFVGLLTGIVSASKDKKCVSLSNQKCEIQHVFNNLHLNKYSQEFQYYPFTVKLDKCVGSCNTLNDWYNKVCVPNKTKNLNLSMFNLITEINELKISTKHISCRCKCKFNDRICNSHQWWNNDKCWCQCKIHNICEKIHIWNPVACICENGKCLASIIDDSGITCDESIDMDAEAKSNDEETKTFPTNLNKKM